MTRTKNILFILADQWRAECLSAVGHPVAKTPHLDALAADGVLFTQHYVQASPCGPSRTSILTGMYLQNHRSVRNGTPLDARFTNLAIEMRRAGYDPTLIGYTDTSVDPRGRPADDPALRTYEGVMNGFRPLLPLPEIPLLWLAHLRRHGYDVPPAIKVYDVPRVPDYPDTAERGPYIVPPVYKAEHSQTAFSTDWAIDHIEAQGNAPWFLHLVYLAPHTPWTAPEPYNRLHDPASVPMPRRTANVAEESRQHPFLAWRLGLGNDSQRLSEAHLRQMRATYYGLISEVDDQIGRLVAYLKRTGRYDDTLIVFSCDHGEMLGDHWALGKEVYFDQAFHVPLIVRAPAGVRGRRVDAFTEAVDLMPTLLDFAGLSIPPQCDGTTLSPWLRDETPSAWREEVHWEYDFRDLVNFVPERALSLDSESCSLNVVRDRHYKYVHFAGLPPLLFDIAQDPAEFRNLAGDSQYAPVMLRYAQKLLSWRMKHAEHSLTHFLLTKDGLVSRGRPSP